MKYDNLTQINPNPVCGLYFDERKDNTLVKILKGKKYCWSAIKIEYITIVQEPKFIYIAHITIYNDQWYLKDMFQAVSDENSLNNLANKKRDLLFIAEG